MLHPICEILLNGALIHRQMPCARSLCSAAFSVPQHSLTSAKHDVVRHCFTLIRCKANVSRLMGPGFCFAKRRRRSRIPASRQVGHHQDDNCLSLYRWKSCCCGRKTVTPTTRCHYVSCPADANGILHAFVGTCRVHRLPWIIPSLLRRLPVVNGVLVRRRYRRRCLVHVRTDPRVSVSTVDDFLVSTLEIQAGKHVFTTSHSRSHSGENVDDQARADPSRLNAEHQCFRITIDSSRMFMDHDF